MRVYLVFWNANGLTRHTAYGLDFRTAASPKLDVSTSHRRRLAKGISSGINTAQGFALREGSVQWASASSGAAAIRGGQSS